MSNPYSPFTFDKTGPLTRKLLRKLAGKGLKLVSTTEEYSEIIWNFLSRKHQNEPLTIIWLQQWDPDGLQKADIGLKIIFKDLENTLLFDDLAKNTDYQGDLRKRIIDYVFRNIAALNRSK